MTAPTPQDIARETVKRLAARKLPPTPDNFTAVYHEVAGSRPLKPFPLEHLRHIGASLPDQTPAQSRFKAQFGRAVSMHSWDDIEKVIVNQLKTVQPAEKKDNHPIALVEEHSLPADMREQVARMVEYTLPALGPDDVRIGQLATELCDYLRQDTQHLPTLRKMLADYGFRLSFVAEDQAKVREALLSVLQTLFANIQAINPENPWLQGQMEALVQATKPPLGLRRLEDVERRLKSLVIKQIEAQEQAQQAQQVMKESLSTFLQRLAQTADNSEKYQKQFEHCAQALQQAQTIADMAPVLDTAIQSARSLALDSRQTTEELTALRNRAEQAEVEVQRLRNELDRMSAAASHDMLTGALNRQGMGEVVDKEMARAQRSGAPLCMAMLDIDDFKRLNDRLGHLSGDAALKHLANVAKASLRTQDSVARFGGEEFVVILPDTSADEATEVLTRLQRELTKELFLEGDQRILITFSAGVVQVQSGETLEQVLQRADLAMYAAKRAGKNRVVVA